MKRLLLPLQTHSCCTTAGTPYLRKTSTYLEQRVFTAKQLSQTESSVVLTFIALWWPPADRSDLKCYAIRSSSGNFQDEKAHYRACKIERCFNIFLRTLFFFHLCSLDSIIVIVSADKAIMYFKLVLKNAPSPVQILLLFSYNNDARPFHLPLIFLLQIGQERKKLPAMNMNSEFGYVICRTETVNSSECIFFFFLIETVFENRI